MPEYRVMGWANLAPSTTVEMDERPSPAEQRDLLRQELRDMGYDPDNFDVEIHETVEQ
ncbi:hypothetical protein PN419_00445 [Halorubrum ezzemoulense]|uniref:hypothetical protein n=1 Tax=Halorubrum ezzemoulense TaxID=337243 RepID=UPI00232B9A80|nr:hypothetical protein [Halorubrum ezzemoulense]MDB9247476.1 hypothetical protein [Halorubrum ezzemoulense]MDB9258615.1 hypothetical protein [Halorubrum ezzemoulense]MDB9268976.1 hypothetical protein [Halorubrum ezzemoulense]MDB9293394.1 hypothetical protein [Halorubrum ezzemoulense]